MKITGKTKVVGVIGDPVEHSCSPQMHNAAFKELAMDYVYVPFHVKPEYLESAIDGFRAIGVVGINVTLPHKKAVLPMLDSISEEAELIGAVNTLVFRDGIVKGHNTDARGFIASLKESGILGLRGMKVVVLGAGGGAQAIVVGLAMEGVAEIIIANRTKEKAVELAKSLGSKTSVMMKGISLDNNLLRDHISESNLLISTITASMDTRIQLVVDPSWFHQGLIVCDIVYVPPETNLLRAASECGLKTIGGMGMLLHQATISFELWTGVKAPIETMRQALINAVYGNK